MLNTKQQRLDEIFRRLKELPRCSTFDEMRVQIATTINEVEDEWTPYPFCQEDLNQMNRLKATDRMYPIQDDNVFTVPGHPEIQRLRSVAHNTFIRSDGSIEIRSTKRSDGSRADPPETGRLIFAKPSRRGGGVWNP